MFDRFNVWRLISDRFVMLNDVRLLFCNKIQAILGISVGSCIDVISLFWRSIWIRLGIVSGSDTDVILLFENQSVVSCEKFDGIDIDVRLLFIIYNEFRLVSFHIPLGISVIDFHIQNIWFWLHQELIVHHGFQSIVFNSCTSCAVRFSWHHVVGFPVPSRQFDTLMLVLIDHFSPLPTFSKVPSLFLSIVSPQALALPFLDSLVEVIAYREPARSV